MIMGKTKHMIRKDRMKRYLYKITGTEDLEKCKQSMNLGNCD